MQMLFKVLIGIFYSFSLFASNPESFTPLEKERSSKDNFLKKEEELHFFYTFLLI